MSKLILGYAPDGAPRNGIGPFAEIFDYGVDLSLRNNLEGIDAVVLWGGADISPSLYDEEPYYNSGPPRPSRRDTFEWELLREATKRGLPIIGVCRGAQLMCAYVGGKLVQHVDGHCSGNHDVVTYDGEVLSTTSCHHQMLWPYEVEHKLLAWCEKPRSGVYQPADRPYCMEYDKGHYKEPEVVYFPQINGFGVQGHPEWQMGSVFNKWVLNEFLSHCFTRCEC